MTRVNQESKESPTTPQSVSIESLKLYTVKQVAQIFQVTEYTVRVWLKEQGGLRGVKMGKGSTGHWRVTGAELVRFANEKFGSDLPQ